MSPSSSRPGTSPTASRRPWPVRPGCPGWTWSSWSTTDPRTTPPGWLATPGRRWSGKAAAMETGAEAVRVVETTAPPGTAGQPRHLLFLDGDLGATAAEAGPLIEPVRAGDADMTIAVFTDRVRQGGHGFVVGLSGAGIERATGWRPAQPLNGQRCLTRAAFELARPLATGFGVETALTIDLLNLGMRVTEVEVPLAHRATGNDWHSQVHRARQFADVARALAVRAIPIGARLRRPGRP